MLLSPVCLGATGSTGLLGVPFNFRIFVERQEVSELTEMGCSPSKGRLFTGVLKTCSSGRGLPQESQEKEKSNRETELESGESDCQLESVLASEERKLPASCQEKIPSLAELAPVLSDRVETQEAKDEILSLQRGTQVNPTVEEQQHNVEKRKLRKSKGGRYNEREDKPSVGPSEANWSGEVLAQTNHAADGHLSPSVPRYEALQNLLDQVTQTHRSLQPIAALMVRRCEEINHELEDMAEKGEMMLREHENKAGFPVALPEQLQHMIQYTSYKMKLRDHSAGGLGDSVLEEAVVYFTALSTQLDERLRAKRVAEQRLAQVLALLGSMGLCSTSGTEDGSLHSEDSSIGAESEWLNGLERQKHHRDSCDPDHSVGISSKSSVGDGRSLTRAKWPLSFGKDASLWLKQETEENPKPLQMMISTETETSPDVIGVQRHSRSMESLHHQAGDTRLVQLEKAQRDHYQQPSWMINSEADGGEPDGSSAFSQPCRKFEQDRRQLQQPLARSCSPSQRKTSIHHSPGWLRRHSSGGMKVDEHEETGDGEGKEDSGALRVYPSSKCLPSPTPLTPGLCSNSSVKRLINTFSCRENCNESYNTTNTPVLFQGVSKYGVPIKPGRGKGETCDKTSKDNCQMRPRTHSKAGDCEVDILPPPSPEVLMDNSFTCREGPSRACAASQHLHSSLQKVTLPRHYTLNLESGSKDFRISAACPIRQDTVTGSWGSADGLRDTDLGPQKEESNALRTQAQTTTQRQDSTESSGKTVQLDKESKRPTSLGPRLRTQGGRGGDSNSDSTALPVISQPATNPPTSKTLTLPPSPSHDHNTHGCPGLFHLPPLPSGQTGLISLASPLQSVPHAGQNRVISHEDNRTAAPVQSFSEAHSNFLQGEAQREIWTGCTSVMPSRPWGGGPRTRLPLSACGPQPYVRRRQSDQQPSLSALARMSQMSVYMGIKGQCRETAISTQGLEDRPTRADEPCDTHPALRDADHALPEHCIVGQAQAS